MYDWDTFINAYHNATPRAQAIVDSDAIPICCRSVVDNEQLDESHYRSLVKLQCLITLGALDRDRAIVEMRTLGIPRAELVYAALQTCVANHEPEQSTDHEELARSIEAVEAALESAPSKTAVPPPATEAEPTHHSSQADVLPRESVTMPTPRWDSDRE